MFNDMGQKTHNGWMWQLLMTVIGTTISIILTFGTSWIVEKNKKGAEGRQLAMMVIHDIDNTAELFRRMAKDEKNSFTQAQYVLNHLDKANSIGADTLNTVLLFVLHDSGEGSSFDDSSEQLFLSSQDSWKNINNTTFIDAVTEFYQSRRETFESVTHGIIWEKPLDENVFYNRQMASDNYMVDGASFLSEELRKDRVRYYIECSPARQRAYNQIADDFEMTSKRCKFLMGITDSEMQKYIESRNHPGKRVKEKDMVGRWVLISNTDMHQGYDFREDHSLISTIIQHYQDPFFTGRIDIHFNYNGTWELQGDSLITVLSAEYDYSIDTSGVGFLPGKRQYVKEILDSWVADINSQMEAATSEESSRLAYHVAIDPSGDRIEMIGDRIRRTGTESHYYITREQ